VILLWFKQNKSPEGGNVMSLRMIGPLLCGGFLLLATAAFAVEGNPVGGIGVDVESSPGGIIISQTQTNGNGAFTFQAAKPGTYVAKYTSGPKKGQVIKTFTVTKAGAVSGKIAGGGAAQ
jgi:hypothetical protein